MSRDMIRFLSICGVVMVLCAFIIGIARNAGGEDVPPRTYSDVAAEGGLSQPPPTLSQDYLIGRWCSSDGARLEFLKDRLTLWAKRLGREDIEHDYALAGSTLSLTTRAGERGSWTLDAIGAGEMSVTRGGAEAERFRRC